MLTIKQKEVLKILQSNESYAVSVDWRTMWKGKGIARGKIIYTVAIKDCSSSRAFQNGPCKNITGQLFWQLKRRGLIASKFENVDSKFYITPLGKEALNNVGEK